MFGNKPICSYTYTRDRQPGEMDKMKIGFVSLVLVSRVSSPSSAQRPFSLESIPLYLPMPVAFPIPIPTPQFYLPYPCINSMPEPSHPLPARRRPMHHAMPCTQRTATHQPRKRKQATHQKKKQRDTTRRKEETQKVTNQFATVYMNAMPCHAMMPKGQSGNQPERDHELLLTICPRSASIHPCPIRP